MASDQYTVKASIVMDTAGFEQAMTRAGRKVKSFGQQATRVGRDLTTAVSGPLLLVTAAAIKTAASFDLAQRKIQALNPKGNIDKLTKSARQLGASTIFTAEQVSQLQLSLAKLGKSDSEISAIQGTILQFAQAMDQDLATSGEFLVKTMNRYADSLKEVGDQTEQAAYVGNLFASVAANTALDATNLANALNYVGSEAAVYGLSLEDTSVILGLLADRGFDASRGGTALRRILAQLAKDGYSAGEAIEQLLSPTAGFSEELKQFGLRGAGPAAALGGLRDEFDELKATISDSGGFLNEFALILDNSITASFKRVKSAAEEVSISFTTEFSESIKLVNQNIARLLRKFAALPKPIKSIIVGLGAFLAIAGPLLLIIGALTSAIGALMSSGLALGALLTGGVAVGVAAAAVAIVLLTKNTDAASMSMGELRRKAYESNEELRDMAKSDLVGRGSLEGVVSLQFEIEKLERKLAGLRRNQLGSSYDRQIDRLVSKIGDLKDKQKAVNDEFKKFLELQKTIAADIKSEQESGQFTGPVIPSFAQNADGNLASEITNVAILLQQRQEALDKISTLKKQARSDSNTGLLDIEGLKAANAELKEFEAKLALVGITFPKVKKEAKDPWPGNLEKAFNDLNPEIASIEDESKRLETTLAELEKIQAKLVQKTLEQKQATGEAGKEDLRAIELNKALTAALEGRKKALEDSTGGEFLFPTQLDEGFVAMMQQDVDDTMSLWEDKMENVKDLALNIGSAFSNIINNALMSAIEGTETFGRALGQGLVQALQRILVKVLALIAAFIVLNILSGGMFAGSGLGAAATQALGGQGMGQFIASGMNLGGLKSGGAGNLRVEGVLSGSDVVLGSRRGATALDRIYG
jgi:predicted  nucleic acid-binding Zn-ribbon protein